MCVRVPGAPARSDEVGEQAHTHTHTLLHMDRPRAQELPLHLAVTRALGPLCGRAAEFVRAADARSLRGRWHIADRGRQQTRSLAALDRLPRALLTALQPPDDHGDAEGGEEA